MCSAESGPENENAIKVIEAVRITMPEGIRLAARIWLPYGARCNPAPAVLEYIPYRRRDRTRICDESMHPYFAAVGYASLRVDMLLSARLRLPFGHYLQRRHGSAADSPVLLVSPS